MIPVVVATNAGSFAGGSGGGGRGNNSTPLTRGSGSHGTSAIAAQAGMNGFLFLVVRADQANVVMA